MVRFDNSFSRNDREVLEWRDGLSRRALAGTARRKSCLQSYLSSCLALVFQFEFECRARGADILAYPPVVAGGNRSNTLHYVKNNQLIKVHEMPFSAASYGATYKPLYCL